MKKANAADIFSLIRESEKITRKEIEAKTGFSWGAVSTIASHLIELNYIREFKCNESKNAGRTPSYLEVNTGEHFVLGVDINISGFKAALVNLKNEVVNTLFYKAAYSDKKTLLNEIIKFIKDAVKLSNGKDIIGIGIAMQGTVDAKKGISVSIPQCRDWKNVPLADILNKEFKIPVFIEHDPDCILYSASAHEVYDNAILLRVDKGIGMSVLMDGKILSKPGIFEIGHTIAVPAGVKCSCGKQGCLEAYASIDGMSALAETEFEELAENAKKGDKNSGILFENMAHYLSLAVSNAAYLLCISKVVLCGDMWQYKDLFFDKFLQSIQTMSVNNPLEFTFTDVENAANGAALIAIERSIEHIDFRKEVD